MSKEILDKQVGEWRKEVDRLNDLIAHATGNVSSATANKTAEEGELLMDDESRMLRAGRNMFDTAKRWGWLDDGEGAFEFIARRSYEQGQLDSGADRASRQVANKAEVDLSSLTKYKYDMPKEDGEYFRVCDVMALLATPPATTGASTALRPTDDELWDATLRDRDAYHDWADKLADAIANYFGVDIGEHSNQNLPWDEALQAIENAEPAGASTVLTDERSQFEAYVRKESDSEEYADSILEKNSGGFYHVVRIQGSWEGWQARSKVAAQAGQVAVPEGWTIVPVEPTDEMLAANGTAESVAGRDWLDQDARDTWAAMLAAAPSPAKESK